jgi:hypothetical protein
MAVIALVAAVVSTAVSASEAIYALVNRPKHYDPVLQDLNASSSADGSPIIFGYGTVRHACQIIWAPPISYTNIYGDGTGSNTKGSITGYVYFGSFCAAVGEGPASVSRIWGDTRLIYLGPGASAANAQVGSYEAWSSTTAYVTGDLVLALTNNEVYEAIYPNTNIYPSNGLYWRQATEYPGWDSATNYTFGSLVSYSTGVYAATSPNSGEAPPTHPNTWKPLAQYYGSPTFYPGDELQDPDPLIQAAESIAAVSANRGLCNFVYDKLPLASFGNRIPNVRAEVTYLKTSNLL